MNKKEEFKSFARLHPELVNYIKRGEMSWQKFYELYDIYGDNKEAWSPYVVNNTSTVSSSIQDKLKNIDMSSIEEHIKTAQKALSLISELTGKSATEVTKEIPKVPRPINQFFED